MTHVLFQLKLVCVGSVVHSSTSCLVRSALKLTGQATHVKRLVIIFKHCVRPSLKANPATMLIVSKIQTNYNVKWCLLGHYSS